MRPRSGGMRRLIPLAAVCLQVFIITCGPRASAEEGVTDDTIVVGMSTALTGPSSFLGISFRAGSEAFFRGINERGGVHGRKIVLKVYDDGYDPGRVVQTVGELIRKDRVFCLFGNVGTPTAMAIKPLITEAKVPLFAPFTGSEALRNPVVRNILNYRASYNQEAEAFVRGLVDMLGYRRIAVFYQNDSYGRAVLKATRAALMKRKLELVVTGTYERNSEDVTAALGLIMKERPEAVVLVGTYQACARFVKEGKKKSFRPTYVSVSFVGPEKFAELLGKDGEKVVVTQVVPPLGGRRLAAVNEYLAAARAYAPDRPPDSVGLEGFLSAKVFVEGLKRAGRDLTREAFIRAVEGIRDLDIRAGNTIRFSADNHQGSHTVYPTLIRDGRFALIDNWRDIR